MREDEKDSGLPLVLVLVIHGSITINKFAIFLHLLGPFQEGLKQIMGIWGSIMPDVFVNRQQTLLTCQSTNNGLSNKNMIVVQSQFGGNITGVPEGLSEIPFFPGIQPDRILGKQFVSMAMDIQVMDDQNQKHKRTYHLEAWNEALTQLLTGMFVDLIHISDMSQIYTVMLKGGLDK